MRVLVTRPAGQAGEWVDGLRAAGLDAVAHDGRSDVAERDMGVGDRWQRAATAKRNRTGPRSSASGPDPQRAGVVDPRNAPATSRHRLDQHARQRYRNARYGATDLQQRLTVKHEPDVRARTTNVDGERPVDA